MTACKSKAKKPATKPVGMAYLRKENQRLREREKFLENEIRELEKCIVGTVSPSDDTERWRKLFMKESEMCSKLLNNWLEQLQENNELIRKIQELEAAGAERDESDEETWFDPSIYGDLDGGAELRPLGHNRLRHFFGDS